MKNFLNKFLSNKNGNVAITFSIALLPVMVCAGAAIDYSRMSRDKSQTQNAIDSAVLSGSRDMLSQNKKKIIRYTKVHMKANLSAQLFKQIEDIDIDVNKAKGTITATLDGATPTTMLGVMGMKKLSYKVKASTKAVSGEMEVILVLDNTNSMSLDNKLVDLKLAATNFVKQLMKNNKSGNIARVGIVPFNQHVNVGLDNRNASWLDVEADSTKIQCNDASDLISSTNCRYETGYDDGVPHQWYQCDHTYGPVYKKCEPVTYVWHGCVGSRKEPFNLKDSQPNRKIPGLMNTAGLMNKVCGNRVTELTYDKNKLISEIAAMDASGETYIPTGLIWGLRMISSNKPFTEGVKYSKAKKDAIKKVIIMMTDGENQKSAYLPHSPFHIGGDLTQADNWTILACDEIKSKNVSLYTVTFGSKITPASKALMENCATNNFHYFHAASGGDLNSAFTDILSNLNKLRLTQ